VRVRVFIDFWNFQLNWKTRMDPQSCDWRVLPSTLIAEAGALLQPTGVTEALTLEETVVYASVDPVDEAKLRGWLTNTIERMPSYRVRIRERRPQPKTIHCRTCGSSFDRCATCDAKYMPRPEKGVDAAIVTDLLSLAFQKSYDLAVLVTGDADFIPAVDYLQSTGLRVVNAAWAGHGYDLKRACWGSFDLDTIAQRLCR
jgi:uncharacterized LabA/DUF88 family protein